MDERAEENIRAAHGKDNDIATNFILIALVYAVLSVARALWRGQK